MVSHLNMVGAVYRRLTNKPTFCIDLEGLEEIKFHNISRSQYPVFDNAIKKLRNTRILDEMESEFKKDNKSTNVLVFVANLGQFDGVTYGDIISSISDLEKLIKRKVGTDSLKKTNRIEISIDAVSGSIFYSKGISNKWFIGGGIGLGGNLNHTLIGPDNYSTTLIKLIHADIIANYEANKNFIINFGINASYSLYGKKNPNDELGYQGLYSGFVTFLYGWKNLKFGTQLSISGLKPKYGGIVKQMRLLIYSTPLVVSYRFKY